MNFAAYYLVADEQDDGKFIVFVSDKPCGNVLMRFNARSYSAAVQKIMFSISNGGHDGVLKANDIGVVAELF